MYVTTYLGYFVAAPVSWLLTLDSWPLPTLQEGQSAILCMSCSNYLDRRIDGSDRCHCQRLGKRASFKQWKWLHRLQYAVGIHSTIIQSTLVERILQTPGHLQEKADYSVLVQGFDLRKRHPYSPDQTWRLQRVRLSFTWFTHSLKYDPQDQRTVFRPVVSPMGYGPRPAGHRRWASV